MYPNHDIIHQNHLSNGSAKTFLRKIFFAIMRHFANTFLDIVAAESGSEATADETPQTSNERKALPEPERSEGSSSTTAPATDAQPAQLTGTTTSAAGEKQRESREARAFRLAAALRDIGYDDIGKTVLINLHRLRLFLLGLPWRGS